MSIFPLPLVPFEHFMLADDRPDYPMTFFVRLKFQGQFARQPFDEALKTALTLHPLLTSRIRGAAEDRTSRLAWVDADGQPPLVDWNDIDAPIQFARGLQIDLRSEIGLRVWVREAEQTTVVTLQIHHCCCDGVGAVSFVETFLTAYHLLQTSASASVLSEAFDLSRLRSRDPSLSSWRQTLKTAWHAMYRVARFINKRSVPLATRRDEPADHIPGDQIPRFQSHSFDKQETEQFQVAARRLKVTVNVLLLRDLFLTLDEWNRATLPNHPHRPIQICIPVNLRDRNDATMPAANKISMSFIHHEPAELADPVHLLTSLQAETERIKRLRRVLAFLPSLRFLGAIRGALSSRVRRSHCFASVVLTNVGVPFGQSRLIQPDQRIVAGGVTLECIEAAPPLRPLTHAAFVALSYGERLTLTIAHDPRWIDDQDGRALLEAFVRRLKMSAQNE